MLFPIISQFGPIQCRIAEALVLLAFFRPDLTFGLTIGCFFANLTGFLMGQNLPLDLLIGVSATLVACLLEAYASPFLFIAVIWPVLLNGAVVGAELYWLLCIQDMPWIACMGYVALGELIACSIGYALFMALMRNKGFMNLLAPNKHETAKF